MAPVLGYWSIRGLGQSLRFLLAHADEDYEDKQYNFGPPPDFASPEWKKDKESLGLEFPNLPYYIDGDVKITESSAIAKYLGRKHGLVGSTETEIIRIDMGQGILHDVGRTLVMLCYDPEFETKKTAFFDEVDVHLTKLSKLVGDNNYIAGSKITWIDFSLFELLERFTALIPDCLDNYANLQAYLKRIIDLPNIKKYRDSPAFQKLKVVYHGPMAKFGGGQ